MSTVDLPTMEDPKDFHTARNEHTINKAHHYFWVRPTANSSCSMTESVSCFGFGDVRQMAMRTGSTDRRISSVPVNSLLDRQIR